jgi:cytochrome c553
MECHDADGLGDENIARVAGQQPDYLREALKRYRVGIGVRLHPDMVRSVKPMSDADIEAVVAYLMSME